MWTIFHTEASMGWGGQEIRILNESISMRERGHTIIIISPAQSILHKKAADCGFETITLSFQKRDYPNSFFKIINLIEQKKPDFINTHSSKDSWVVSIATRVSKNKPFIIRTRHLSTPVAKNIMGSIIYKLLPHKIITTGEAIKEQLIERNCVPPHKIISIPTGVDFSIFDSKKVYKNIRNELSLAEQTPIIGMVSALRSWKGHSYFIEAADLILRKLPQLKFLIVGDGPQKYNLEKMITDKNLSKNILMLGHRNDVPDIMASLDILVHPSYANEGVPQAILQGMAMEVPVIASDLRPLGEVAKDMETALIVPVKNSEKLAEKIMQLKENKRLRNNLINNARKLILESFSVNKMIDSIEALYNGLLEKKKRH